MTITSLNTFIAVISLIIGVIATNAYNRSTIAALKNAKCPRPHLGDIQDVEKEIERYLGTTLNELNSDIDDYVVEIKNKFGI